MNKAKEFLEDFDPQIVEQLNSDYVYEIKDVIVRMEQYANQRVIEELEKHEKYCINELTSVGLYYFDKRIKELKK